MLLSKTIRLFLDGIGRREEYEYYLKALQPEGDGCFAAIFPSLDSLGTSCDLMVFDLRFLLQVNLVPLVVLCGEDAPMMMAALADYDDVVYIQHCKAGADLAGETAALLEAARNAERIPVLAAPAVSLTEACLSLSPTFFRRIHILRNEGGLKDQNGSMIWYYWLRGKNPQPAAAEEHPLLEHADTCLKHLPSLHFAVASPLNLLQELFTVRGKGSIIRTGSELLVLDDPAQVDQDRLFALLEDAFGKPLQKKDFLHTSSRVILEARYRGAAILEQHSAGFYLNKFAVGMQARGEGLAQELWNEVLRTAPGLFWRSRKGNTINTWYDRQADGRHAQGNWTVYWKGIGPENLPGVIDHALSRPEDFQS